MAATVLGGIGFPVILEVLRRTRLPWQREHQARALGDRDPAGRGHAAVPGPGVGQPGHPRRLPGLGQAVRGGGSAGTAGGIKVGTLAVLVAAVVAEARGDTDAGVFGRRIAPATVRQALAVIGLYLAVVGTATTLLLHLSGERMADVLFEVISATATVGLSTGITPDLPPGGDRGADRLHVPGPAGPGDRRGGAGAARAGPASGCPRPAR